MTSPKWICGENEFIVRSKKANIIEYLNKNDTFPLPFADKLTKLESYTKHSFWLNADYIKNNIYFNSNSTNWNNFLFSSFILSTNLFIV